MFNEQRYWTATRDGRLQINLSYPVLHKQKAVAHAQLRHQVTVAREGLEEIEASSQGTFSLKLMVSAALLKMSPRPEGR